MDENAANDPRVKSSVPRRLALERVMRKIDPAWMLTPALTDDERRTAHRTMVHGYEGLADVLIQFAYDLADSDRYLLEDDLGIACGPAMLPLAAHGLPVLDALRYARQDFADVLNSQYGEAIDPDRPADFFHLYVVEQLEALRAMGVRGIQQ